MILGKIRRCRRFALVGIMEKSMRLTILLQKLLKHSRANSHNALAGNGEVYHYRDKTNLECDAVVHLRNGSYGLMEIKLGGERLVEEGVKTLKKLEARLDTTRMKQPSFLAVLTGVGSYAYQREDGVYIIPIGTLRP